MSHSVLRVLVLTCGVALSIATSPPPPPGGVTVFETLQVEGGPFAMSGVRPLRIDGLVTVAGAFLEAPDAGDSDVGVGLAELDISLGTVDETYVAYALNPDEEWACGVPGTRVGSSGNTGVVGVSFEPGVPFSLLVYPQIAGEVEGEASLEIAVTSNSPSEGEVRSATVEIDGVVDGATIECGDTGA